MGMIRFWGIYLKSKLMFDVVDDKIVEIKFIRFNFIEPQQYLDFIFKA